MSKQDKAAEIIKDAVDAKVNPRIHRWPILSVKGQCRHFAGQHATAECHPRLLSITFTLMQIGKSGVDLKGTPEEVAERLVKEEGGQDIKERELEHKGAHRVPGVAGSGLERGEPAAVAQVPCSAHMACLDYGMQNFANHVCQCS